MDNNPKPSEIIILASGAVVFIFSFFKYLSQGDFDGPSAWGDGLFPTYALPAIFGLIMAVQIALAKFANMDFPAEVAGFTWRQIHLVLAVFAALILISFLIVDKGGSDLAFGFWLSLLGSIGLVVGAVMMLTESDTPGGAGGTPPPPQQF